MNIISPISCFTGYGITGYNIWKQLYDNNNDTALFNIGDVSIEHHWEKENIISSLKNQINYNQSAPCLKIWHTNDIVFRPIGHSKYGCLTFFELDKIPQVEITNINRLDYIFVASTWAKNILLQNNITTNIIVAPQGVDRTVFNDQYELTENETDKYIFINIGKWEVRKGHDLLYKIFNKAFKETDNVELWMINSNPFLSAEKTQKWIDLYKNSKLGNKIKILPRIPSQKELASIMQQSHCGIFPSRAEGWNNEAIEMLSLGKPLIITNYSAHTEYCDHHNSYLIHINKLCRASDDIWFKNTDGKWADLDDDCIDQTIEHMRHVYKNNIIYNQAGIETSKSLSWSKTASIIEQNLNG